VNHNLHHAKAQRTHLLPDDFQSVHPLLAAIGCFNSDRAHISKNAYYDYNCRH
jgi:hypothetical protein